MIIKKFTLFLFSAVMLAMPVLSVHAAEAESVPAEKLDIKLAVIGAADPLYSWWGHIAFIIENRETGAGRFYDYGNFSFEQDSFLKNFIMGRMYYLKMASNPDRQLRYNAYLNRDITIYTLNVQNPAKIELLKLLENDILPENRVYLYNLFLDNCSTRIRDRMDIITGGEFSRKYSAVSDKTLRIQLRRFLYSNVPMDLLLNFALSGMTDKPATEYEGMFLPAEMARGVENLSVTDESGKTVPFVRSKTVYHRADGRPFVPDYPPSNVQYGLIAGLLLGAAAFFSRGRGRAVFSLIYSFLLAVPGLLLFFMAFFTDHNYTHWNVNLLFINPFLFFTFALSIRKLSNKDVQSKSLRICWLATSAGAALSVLLKLIPACRQDNWSTLLIVLPAAIILALDLKNKSRKENASL